MKTFFELRKQLKEAHDPEDYIEVEDEEELEIEDLEATELMPRSPGERAFKQMHMIKVKKHPVALDHQFKATNSETIHQPFNGDQQPSVTESFKPGPLELKSSEKVNIDRKTAEFLNNVISDMDEQQRSKIIDDITTSKKSFNKTIGILKASADQWQ